MDTPRIYVACLAAYNNGYLHGEWIDCDQDVEDIYAEIQKMLKASPVAHFECCEEYAIHDYEGWHDITIHDYESIEKLAELAKLIEKHGAAIALYYNYHGNTDDFEDDYLGEYESEQDFVYEWLAQDGTLKKWEEAGLNESYIDFEQIATDWFMDSFLSLEESYKKIHVFSRH